MMRHVFLATFFAVALAAVPAQAIVVYDLTVDHCTGGCNPGSPGTSMGTVSLAQSGAGAVQVTVTLVSPLKFINTGLHETIDFNLIGAPTISVDNFSNSNFSLTSTTAGTQHFDGFGDFEYAIQLNTAQGAGGAQASPVSFIVHAAGLTEGSFATNGTGANAFFGVDVINTVNGSTGPIGTGGGGTVPEPTSVVLFGTVLAGVGLWLRKRVEVNI